MYEGKFDAQVRGQQAPGETLKQILKERDEAIAAKAAAKAARSNRTAQTTPTKPAAAQSAPAAKSAPAARPQKPAKAEKPARAEKPAARKMDVVVEEKKGARIGGLVFYTIYFLGIFAFFIGVFGLLNWLNGWLKQYEAAQPDVKCQEVFDQLFVNPDWEQLYRYAGVADTDFEGSDEYVRYMQKKVGGQPLNYVETSAGLSGNKKYIVRLGTEKLATFTLIGRGESLTDIPDWKLGDIELFFERNESYLIKKLENHIAYVNGVPLDDSYTIQITSSRVDEYLPVGANSIRTSIQQISDLMAEPQIVVYDQTGTQQMVALYNPDSKMYEEQVDAIAMGEAERAAVFGALESKCEFMIHAADARSKVSKYFESGSQAYNDIVSMAESVTWNTDRGHEFVNEEILFYTKHSDTLFSVRASVTMRATLRETESSRDYVDTESMFFVLKDGKWLCTETMNTDISEPVGQVRLTFKDDNGNILSNEFYSTEVKSIQAPVVQAPAGMRFSGWYRITIDSNGVKSGEVVFVPDESGVVTLPGKGLEAMTLFPHFEAVQ